MTLPVAFPSVYRDDKEDKKEGVEAHQAIAQEQQSVASNQNNYAEYMNMITNMRNETKLSHRVFLQTTP